MSANGKVKVATLWLSGCSGCHMSFLDLDERLLELSKLVDIKASPIVDIKFDQIPEVDVGIVEGCVNNNEQEEHLRHLRDKCKILIALGDCAITGNVPTLRNRFQLDVVMQRAFVETESTQIGEIPTDPDAAAVAEGPAVAGDRQGGCQRAGLPAGCGHDLVCADGVAGRADAEVGRKEFEI